MPSFSRGPRQQRGGPAAGGLLLQLPLALLALYGALQHAAPRAFAGLRAPTRLRPDATVLPRLARRDDAGAAVKPTRTRRKDKKEDFKEEEAEELSYVLDDDYSEAMALEVKEEEITGQVKHFGVSVVEGLPILSAPDGEEVDVLLPGDVVATECRYDLGVARLLDDRGWLKLQDGLEEVEPWAAQVMRKPRVSKNDANSLAYVSLDGEGAIQEHLPLPRRVISEMNSRGIEHASAIQEAVWDRVHRGESMCLQSQTGTGKTLAMMLPLITAMQAETEWGRHGDKVVVVTSSRELAVQLMADIDSLGFYPQGQGHTTTIIVGNIPGKEAILNANIIIGTPNELCGVLHKDLDMIKQINTQLRAIVLDEVDEYTTAPRMFASPWRLKRMRRKYNEKKMVLDKKLAEFNTGIIEWFMRRTLAYARRRDLQLLAASATMNRNMARKIFRLLRWDPLGRWYDNPPPLLRPRAMMEADWQAVPFMPTVPQHLHHTYVQVVKDGSSETKLEKTHWTRKPIGKGGIPRLRIRNPAGNRKNLFGGQWGRPFSEPLARSLLDGLHDVLKARPPGSCMVLLCRTCGLTVREVVRRLHQWGFWEAQGMHHPLWEDKKDYPSRWAQLYTYDELDHSAELATKHRNLNKRLKEGRPEEFPVGSKAWKRLRKRKFELNETVAPIMVGFEGNGRGIHYEGVDTVYILGVPRKPSVYMHMAGRVGHLGTNYGKVVSIIPKRANKLLESWARKIGPDVTFQKEDVVRVRSKKLFAERSTREEWEELERYKQRKLEEKEARRKKRKMLPEGKDYVTMPSEDEGEGQEMEELTLPLQSDVDEEEYEYAEIPEPSNWMEEMRFPGQEVTEYNRIKNKKERAEQLLLKKRLRWKHR